MHAYISTRNRNLHVTSHEAVMRGLSEEGGLFFPEVLDIHIDPSDLRGMSYQEMAARIISAYLDDYSPEDIRNSVYGAYDEKFDSSEIVPLRGISAGYLMDLWHGPTSAFKDLALTVLPRLMTCACRMEDYHGTVAILTATSGDTGKAALAGFRDVPGTAVTVFYPEDGVSPVQKRQMQTAEGNNVRVIAVQGNFDDCQRMVKEASVSEQVRNASENVRISSANSINIGRLIPQIVYYYASYVRLADSGAIACGDEVSFSVPTGNFGDILAGYLAKRAGLPVRHLICASNKNHVLTDFLETGTYSTNRPFYTTMSPSMDILVSSNLERLLFEESGHDDELIRSLMKSLNETGTFRIPEEMLASIRNTFEASWCDEDACAGTIRNFYELEHVLIDPHTAVAVHGMNLYREKYGTGIPCIALSTASPYKFAIDVYQALTGIQHSDGFEAMQKLHEMTGEKIPANLADLQDKPVRFTQCIARDEAMHVITERMKEIGE